jgi:(1->4)-alpha-D-glucan 1-alpha-D-glucosylmutase
LRETIACLRVYRTYITREAISVQDRRQVEEACQEAARRRPELDPELVHLLRSLLLMEAGAGEVKDELVARYQQTTGPVMAKAARHASRQ